MRIKIRTWLGLLAVLTLNHTAFSQKNFVPGVIETLNNETLSGLIDYKNWEVNPTSISFKKDSAAAVVNYTPLSIKSFKVANDYYTGKIVSVDKSPYRLEDLVYLDTKSYIDIDTVFLSVYVLGAANLYYLKDKDQKEHFYWEKTGTDIAELIYKTTLKKVDGKSMIERVERYKGQLIYYFADCPKIKDKISYTVYNSKGMIKLFEEYNKCKNAESTFLKKYEKTVMKVGVTGGLSITALNMHQGFEDRYSLMMIYPEFNYAYSPVIGLSLNIVLPRSRDKWSLYNELLFKSYDVQSSFRSFYMNENYYGTVNLSLGGTYLKLSNMVRYQVPFKKVKPFVNVGFSNAIAIALVNHRSSEDVYYSNHTIETGLAAPNPRGHEIGLTGGAGVQVRKFSAELRYETGNGMAKDVITKNIYFLIGYQF